MESQEPTTAEALQEIEKECELDEKCRQTAVTFVDGKAACEYHSGELLSD
jgi:hypothetical protein